MKAASQLLIAAGVAFILGGLFDFPAAKAADGKTIAGSSCVAFMNGGGAPLFNPGRGRIMNQSGVNYMFVYCPLVRDNPTAKPTHVEAVVVDNSSPTTGVRDVSCFVTAASPSGNQIANGATVKTSGTNSNGQALVLPIPATAFPRGAYFVTCTIPRHGVGDPLSGIASIYYEETD